MPAQYTSEECSTCEHIHQDSRQSQASFVCQRCGYSSNADINASINIARRGVRLVLSGEYRIRKRKQTMRLKSQKQIGVERSELRFQEHATPVEIRVSRGSGNTVAHRSRKLETPTTTTLGV